MFFSLCYRQLILKKMEYGKNTIQEFAEEMQEQCQNGASQSDILQMIEDWQKPLVHHKDTTCGLFATDRPDLIKDEKGIMFQISF